MISFVMDPDIAPITVPTPLDANTMIQPSIPTEPVSISAITDDKTQSNGQSSADGAEEPVASPITLLDLLSNSLVLRQVASQIDVAARLALAATNKAYHRLLLETEETSPQAFRHLDLSLIKVASLDGGPIDPGGISWRSQRMDEALTEDEFYSGPIRGIMSKLASRHILNNITTMILDGLSVPADLVREIIVEPQYNVRILSVREAKHLNERKLMQVLRYVCRPSRPQGTPKLQGLYVFGPKDPSAKPEEPEVGRRRSPTRYPDSPTGDIVNALGAQLGAEWNQRSQALLNAELSKQQDKWWQPSGAMFKRDPLADWAETLKCCADLIFFDAVLCRGPGHTPKTVQGPAHNETHTTWWPDALATVALGSHGCAKCGTTPEGPACFGGRAPSTQLPMLAPPPLHSSSVREAQRPFTAKDQDDSNQRLIVRCKQCLKGRWCERCHKWWCEDCYEVPNRGSHNSHSNLTALQQTEMFQAVAQVATMGAATSPPTSMPAITAGGGDKEVKMGTKRDCFGCGWTCADCKEHFIRACKICSNEYCLLDNDGSSKDTCDWCNYSGRRTRELY